MRCFTREYLVTEGLQPSNSVTCLELHKAVHLPQSSKQLDCDSASITYIVDNLYQICTAQKVDARAGSLEVKGEIQKGIFHQALHKFVNPRIT